jgi:hypothetical protein
MTVAEQSCPRRRLVVALRICNACPRLCEQSPMSVDLLVENSKISRTIAQRNVQARYSCMYVSAPAEWTADASTEPLAKVVRKAPEPRPMQPVGKAKRTL